MREELEKKLGKIIHRVSIQERLVKQEDVKLKTLQREAAAIDQQLMELDGKRDSS